MLLTRQASRVVTRSSSLWLSVQQTSCLCSTSVNRAKTKLPTQGPSFQDFLASSSFQGKSRGLQKTPDEAHPYLTEEMLRGDGLKGILYPLPPPQVLFQIPKFVSISIIVYLDVYGCQMNVNDTEVVWSILESKGYIRTLSQKKADVWLVVTCSIREGAEAKVWTNLTNIQRKRRAGVFKKSLKVGLLGCMAERLKDRMLSTPEKLVDLVTGPDAYRDLPRLLAVTKHSNSSAINVLLSLDETYSDVRPSRLNSDSVTGFVSIQRGCDNMCAYCIVPFTRGRERSRPIATILDEVRALADQGVKEVTLLGQNVNSYRDDRAESLMIFGTQLTQGTVKGFETIYKPKIGGIQFADLLQKVSEIDPEIRIRFTSPHPKDFPDEVLHLIASTANICNQLHLPAQCGSTRILEAMRRGYTRQSYLELVERVREVIPGVRLSGDMIAGFCDETDEEFEQTLSLITTTQYGTLFCFPYSMREVLYLV
jgi:MiaB/RimO family radical SAM methylthiotransferase